MLDAIHETWHQICSKSWWQLYCYEWLKKSTQEQVEHFWWVRFTRFLPCFENIAAEPFIHKHCIIATRRIVWNWFLWNFLTSRLSPITEILFSPIIALLSVVWNDSLCSCLNLSLTSVAGFPNLVEFVRGFCFFWLSDNETWRCLAQGDRNLSFPLPSLIVPRAWQFL